MLIGLMSACSSHDDEGLSVVGSRTVTLRIFVPMGDDLSTRAPGDPGVSSSLSAPTIAYVFFVQNGNVVTLRNEANDADLPCKFSLADDFGTAEEEDYAGTLSTTDDRVWRFPSKKFTVTDGSKAGKFYVVVSNRPLMSGGTELSNLSVSTEADVLALTFDLNNADADEQAANIADLPNIYSTPYNYQPDGSTYYGTLPIGADHVVDLMLYHVAARVDVKWNVDASLQTTRKVKTMAVDQLKLKGCKIFKPMENTSLGDSPYSLSLKTVAEVGRQWYGRASFYAIPYVTSDHFPMDLVVDNSDASHTTTVKLNMTAADLVFVPWIRVNLTYDEETDFTQSTLNLGD